MTAATATPQPRPRRISSANVLEVIQDVCNVERSITRERISEITGLRMSIVDDHVRRLVDDGCIVRLKAGVFEVAQAFPPARPISKTLLPSGLVKLEIGSEYFELSPREVRMMGSLFAGDALAYSNVDNRRGELDDVVTTASRSSRELAKIVRALSQQMIAHGKQGILFPGTPL